LENISHNLESGKLLGVLEEHLGFLERVLTGFLEEHLGFMESIFGEHLDF
jgi:hypothetical protein